MRTEIIEGFKGEKNATQKQEAKPFPALQRQWLNSGLDMQENKRKRGIQMIKIEDVEIIGWESAIRGMRNPLNSWDRIDSEFEDIFEDTENLRTYYEKGCDLGDNDLNLMKKLANSGSSHSKYRRMIIVYVDITAPLYFWKEFDTYKVGTVANSCSTMHTIHKKEFTLDDFSHEHLMFEHSYLDLYHTIDDLNYFRRIYLNGGSIRNIDGTRLNYNPKEKDIWWQMIQLLPSSYNQKRTVMLNYEVLSHMYYDRKGHKLDEWREFCNWIEGLPYAKDIIIKSE